MTYLSGTLLFAAGFCAPWLLLMLFILFTDDTPASVDGRRMAETEERRDVTNG